MSQGASREPAQADVRVERVLDVLRLTYVCDIQGVGDDVAQHGGLGAVGQAEPRRAFEVMPRSKRSRGGCCRATQVPHRSVSMDSAGRPVRCGVPGFADARDGWTGAGGRHTTAARGFDVAPGDVEFAGEVRSASGRGRVGGLSAQVQALGGNPGLVLELLCQRGYLRCLLHIVAYPELEG